MATRGREKRGGGRRAAGVPLQRKTREEKETERERERERKRERERDAQSGFTALLPPLARSEFIARVISIHKRWVTLGLSSLSPSLPPATSKEERTGLADRGRQADGRMNGRKKGGGKEEQWVRLDGKRRRPLWGLSRGTWFGCSKHSSSSSSSSSSSTSSVLVGGWSRMLLLLLLLLLLLQRTTVAGCRCTREERTKAEDEQWCRRWVVDFLRSTYNEATAEETVRKEREREREREKSTDNQRVLDQSQGFLENTPSRGRANRRTLLRRRNLPEGSIRIERLSIRSPSNRRRSPLCLASVEPPSPDTLATRSRPNLITNGAHGCARFDDWIKRTTSLHPRPRGVCLIEEAIRFW